MDEQEVGREDQTLECVDCAEKFVFSVGEQRFFAERGLRAPRRCRECRRAKREFYADAG
jgi:hypothetical protein